MQPSFKRNDVCSINNNAIGTWYDLPGGTTACGHTFDPDSISAAVCTNLPGLVGPGAVIGDGPFCEASILVTNVNTGIYQWVTLEDSNASCGQPGDPYTPFQLDFT